MHEMHFVCSFFSAARRTNQEAPPRLSGFWLVATVAVGVCGTRFARTVLALFPPSSLRLHRPIKAESGACLYSNPPLLLSLRVFLTPPSLRTPPLYFALQNTEEEGESNPPLIAVRYPAYGTRQGRIVIQRIFFPSPRKSLLH